MPSFQIYTRAIRGAVIQYMAQYLIRIEVYKFEECITGQSTSRGPRIVEALDGVVEQDQAH